MKKAQRVFGVLALMAVLAGWSSLQSFVLGADDKPAQEKDQRAEPRGWLPQHYSKLIDGLQRDAIYKVQDKYEPQIEKLQQQITDLEAKRDKEIEALLRPDQLAKLKELRAEADQARAEKQKASQEKKDGAKATKAKTATAAK